MRGALGSDRRRQRPVVRQGAKRRDAHVEVDAIDAALAQFEQQQLGHVGGLRLLLRAQRLHRRHVGTRRGDRLDRRQRPRPRRAVVIQDLQARQRRQRLPFPAAGARWLGQHVHDRHELGPQRAERLAGEQARDQRVGRCTLRRRPGPAGEHELLRRVGILVAATRRGEGLAEVAQPLGERRLAKSSRSRLLIRLRGVGQEVKPVGSFPRCPARLEVEAGSQPAVGDHRQFRIVHRIGVLQHLAPEGAHVRLARTPPRGSDLRDAARHTGGLLGDLHAAQHRHHLEVGALDGDQAPLLDRQWQLVSARGDRRRIELLEFELEQQQFDLLRRRLRRLPPQLAQPHGVVDALRHLLQVLGGAAVDPTVAVEDLHRRRDAGVGIAVRRGQAGLVAEQEHVHERHELTGAGLELRTREHVGLEVLTRRMRATTEGDVEQQQLVLLLGERHRRHRISLPWQQREHSRSELLLAELGRLFGRRRLASFLRRCRCEHRADSGRRKAPGEPRSKATSDVHGRGLCRRRRPRATPDCPPSRTQPPCRPSSRLCPP